MIYRETTVFGKHHTRRPLCLDPIIQTMFSMLLKTFQNGIIASENILISFQCKKWWIRWRFWWACILVFLFDPMIQNIILPQIGLPQEEYSKHAIQGDHCVWETPYRETIVFQSHDPKYYATSDWLAPGKILKTCHSGRPLCLGNAIQGDHCIPIPWSKILYYLRLACPRTNIYNMPYRETTVFGKRHTGRPLYSDPMIQNIILPQIGLPQEKYFKHAIQGDHCGWETPYRETTVFRRRPWETTEDHSKK